MIPKKAKAELEKRIKQSGTQMADLTAAKGLRLMFEFYKDLRVNGCELEADGDMLLYQWGTYSFDGSPSFQLNITRQFITSDPDMDDDDSEMSQLSLTFHFTPSQQFDKLKDGNRWCGNPDELQDFEEFINGTDAYNAVCTSQPKKVTLDYSDV